MLLFLALPSSLQILNNILCDFEKKNLPSTFPGTQFGQS